MNIDIPRALSDEVLSRYAQLRIDRGDHEVWPPELARELRQEDMHEALRAALGAWVVQRGKTYYDTRDSSLPTQVDWNHPEPGAKENVYTMRQEKPE